MRTLFIGTMHGMAGSVALTTLTLNSTQSIPLGFGYVLMFGLGSIVGMGALSMIISIPMRKSSTRLTWLHNSLQFTVGLVTATLGAFILFS